MPQKKRSRTASMDLESMKTLAECPICFEIPRDGVMLQCVNGHNVCDACKNKMAEGAKCPQGECDYNDPPTRNRTVAGIVEKLTVEFPCKFAKATEDASGCEFVGTKILLEQHEDACQHRLVPCINWLCKKLVSASKIIEHLKTEHNANVGAIGAGSDVIVNIRLWKKEDNISRSGDSSWSDLIRKTSASWVISCAHFRDGQVYLWLVMLADKSETDKFQCQLILSKDDQLMSFSPPVYPIDWTREQIMKDERCVCLSNYSIRQMLTEEGISEDSRRAGYVSKFRTTFKIVKKTV